MSLEKKIKKAPFPFTLSADRFVWRVGDGEYQLEPRAPYPGGSQMGVLFYACGDAQTMECLGSDRYHWDKMVPVAVAHAAKHHAEALAALDRYTRGRLDLDGESK